MSDARFEADTPFSDDDINAIENSLKRKLPSDYVNFVKQYGPAFVGGAVDGDENLSVLCFLGRGKDGVSEMLDEYDDLWEDSLFPFARCELGNRWILDENNEVFYINYYGSTTKVEKVSDSFQDFLDRIIVVDD
jgi:hypothetical protein